MKQKIPLPCRKTSGGHLRMLCIGSLTLALNLSPAMIQAETSRIVTPASIIQQKGIEEIVIKGRVVNAKDKSALPGVSVVIKGTSKGVTTDVEGNYSITVDGPQDVLVFSFVGNITQEVTVGNRSVVDVDLAENAELLSEVVVVGYGSQTRERTTSAISNITAANFNNSGARNAMDLIQGKVAGLSINRSGSNPNSGVSMQLRGVTSLTGGLGPLVVIDGIPGGNLDLLQQDDVESISVLKDGSAAAIYGTRANGGVILVTTKKGQAGGAKFDYNTYFRKEFVRNRLDFMNADQFRARIAEGIIPASADYGSTTDAYDELINHGNLSQNHNLALSGGAKGTTYRASLYYQDLQGIAKENGRKQYGGRLTVMQTGLKDRLTAQLNLATNFNRANRLGGGGWEGSLIRNPTLSFYNPDGSYYFEQTSTNEVARLKQETNRRQQQTTSADAKFSLEILPGLQASIFGAVQRDSYIDGAYRSLDSEFSKENDVYPNGGYASRYTYLSNNYTLEPTVSFDRTFGTNHTINAVGGYSYQYAVQENFQASNYGFVNDIFEENNLGAGNQLTVGKAGMGSGKGDNTLIAFFGRANYSFMDKYMVSLILRHEGSSRFGTNNKWGNFPAASIGWNISKEKFMEGVSFVNNLKLRAGFGVTGNQDIANYSSLVTLGTGGVYINPDGEWRQTYGPNRNPNPNLKWERKNEYNIGADFTVLNKRLSGSLDLFKRVTSDLLYNYTSQLPPFVRETIYTNVGSISNRGVELTLNATAVKAKDFSWTIDATGSYVKNIADDLSNDVYKVEAISTSSIGGYGALGEAIRIEQGGQLGNFYGKRFAGFTEDGKWLFFNRNGEKVRFDQINNSADPNVSDLSIIGNAIPKFNASLTNNFTYKNLSLRVFMRGRFDYDILNTMDLSYGNKVSIPNNLLNSTFEKHAKLNDTYQYSDYYLESGSFLKLDEITLSYNFNLKSDLIRNLRVYATGANLATFTKYTGNDPDFVNDTGLGREEDEQRRLGIDGRSAYPNTRSFLVGLSFGF
ncbi:SusC/RagA family TonB-linked outer membrane protein [Dyadobacter sp. CY312]|uniref:SusC/RagA family TonB-linked outer membrane protein n=1 Tax=Dyadobacter sp. CY312 TaxID=2907303 RepID=UPI001F29267C|nr:SusC/RagA family TonB-linked outer membrane protein [Dyadobacter sp. CY312]MCE7041921.1 SusC/RagA family TonB-linked outer membrane protein [Dyadobacter sp. CY312]